MGPSACTRQRGPPPRGRKPGVTHWMAPVASTWMAIAAPQGSIHRWWRLSGVRATSRAERRASWTAASKEAASATGKPIEEKWLDIGWRVAAASGRHHQGDGGRPRIPSLSRAIRRRFRGRYRAGRRRESQARTRSGSARPAAAASAERRPRPIDRLKDSGATGTAGAPHQQEAAYPEEHGEQPRVPADDARRAHRLLHAGADGAQLGEGELHVLERQHLQLVRGQAGEAGASRSTDERRRGDLGVAHRGHRLRAHVDAPRMTMMARRAPPVTMGPAPATWMQLSR